MDDVERAVVDEHAELLGDEHLADAERDGRLRADLDVPVEVRVRRGVLEPEQVERRQRAGDADGVGHVELAVEVDAQLEVGADGLADDDEALDRAIDLVERQRPVPDVALAVHRDVVDVELDLPEARCDGLLAHRAPRAEVARRSRATSDRGRSASGRGTGRRAGRRPARPAPCRRGRTARCRARSRPRRPARTGSRSGQRRGPSSSRPASRAARPADAAAAIAHRNSEISAFASSGSRPRKYSSR